MIAIPGTILCAGNLTQDILAWPVDEVVFNTTVWVDDLITSLGGNGANTACAIGLLGGRVRLTGMVGQDARGDALLDQLRAAGVDAVLARSPLPTPATVVIVRSDGARSFLHRPGASREAFAGGLEFTQELAAGCSHFHLANPFSMPNIRKHAPAVLARAKAAGLTTSLDTGWDAFGDWLKIVGPCFENLDLLFVNAEEAEKLSGRGSETEAAEFFREHGVRNTVVKLGAGGCAVFDSRECVRVPAFRVHVVDSTGAGDCFAGAFLAALQRGMPVPEAARFANAVGALNVECPGATTGLLDFEGTLQWMARAQ